MRIDIAILGAGPAGCAAALAARQAGFGVALLDVHAHPRPAPGETLHPGVEAIFKKLGVWEAILSAGFHRHRGVWKESNGRRSFEAYGEDSQVAWLGFQAERETLHAILRRAAEAAGAQVIWPIAPQCVFKNGNRIVGVGISQHEIYADWVLDATGYRAWLPRTIGLAGERISPRIITRYGWTSDEDPELDGQPLFIQSHQKWRWTAPLGNGRSAWVESTISDGSCTPVPPNQCGLDLSWRVHRACAGPGYFLLGDAAALFDPSTSGGVLRAMMSGIFSVYCIEKFKQRELREEHALATYTNWINNLVSHYTARYGIRRSSEMLNKEPNLAQ